MRCVLGKGKAGNWVMLSTCLKMSRLMSIHSLVLRDFLNVFFQLWCYIFKFQLYCHSLCYDDALLSKKNKWIYENKRDPIANSTISCKHTWKCTCKHTNLHRHFWMHAPTYSVKLIYTHIKSESLYMYLHTHGH